MIEFDNIENVYFIGAGGIGMSALARFFKHQGKRVAGYDKTPTVLTAELQKEGIDIHFEDDVDLIAPEFKKCARTLVVYTPAIPRKHHELNFFIEEGFDIKKRAEVLGIITRKMEGVCVAGTHGKTTISTMTTHLYTQSKIGCSAFIGGISRNYETNFLHHDTSRFVIMEADEFDRSFLQLKPFLALISAMDADHLDIYGSAEKVNLAFKQFANKIQPGGVLVMKDGLPLDDLKDDFEIFTYSMNKGSDFYPTNIKLKDGLYHFTLISPLGNIENLKMGVPGLLNVENMVGAMALALLGGVEPHEIQKAVPEFMGIRRRFDYRIKRNDLVFIDDYAHHPEEIKATINSVKDIFPGKKITVAFQPHLFSRTQDFADGFAESLDMADRVVLLDIYPARELPIEGVSSKMIGDRMKLNNVEYASLTTANEIILSTSNEIILTLGAGDIDTIVPVLEEALRTNA